MTCTDNVVSGIINRSGARPDLCSLFELGGVHEATPVRVEAVKHLLGALNGIPLAHLPFAALPAGPKQRHTRNSGCICT